MIACHIIRLGVLNLTLFNMYISEKYSHKFALFYSKWINRQLALFGLVWIRHCTEVTRCNIHSEPKIRLVLVMSPVPCTESSRWTLVVRVSWLFKSWTLFVRAICSSFSQFGLKHQYINKNTLHYAAGRVTANNHLNIFNTVI